MYVVLIRESDIYMWEAVFASRNLYIAQFVAFFYLWKYEVDVRYSPQRGYL